MKYSLKIVFIAAAIVGFLIVAAAVLYVFVDVDAYKPRLEAAASDALGMEVQVGGRLGVGFFPGLHVTLEDVRIRNRGADIASAREASLGIDLLPLLYRKIRIGSIVLKQPHASIERGRDGKLNFEGPGEAGGSFPALDLKRVSLSRGMLRYADKQSGKEYEARDCSLNAGQLRLPGGGGLDALKNLAVVAEFACREIRTNDVTVSDLKFSVNGRNGVYELKPVTARIFDGQGSGSIRLDFSGAAPVYDVRYSLSKVRISRLLESLSPKKVAEGSIDISANLSLRGKSANALRRNMNGQFSLRGEDLTLDGEDLDREISRLESSQSFSLVDAGALFLAGPMGLAVTKGYSFASFILPSPLALVNHMEVSAGSSRIRTLVSEWKVEDGVAQAADVAMATDKNRIALKGRLDFVNDQFDDVTVAVIDAKGCAKMQQKIHGPLEKPIVEKPGILTSLAGPAIKLLKETSDLFPGRHCDVFYDGSVAPPK